MKITIVCENSVASSIPRRLIGEHGLSILIEDRARTFLFDTGQGVGLIRNLKALGKDINAIDALVLSHGHYDHTGGLLELLVKRTSPLPVYLHLDAFMKKTVINGLPGSRREVPIGFPASRKEYEANGAEFIFIRRFTEIADRIYAINEVKHPPGWVSWDTRLMRNTDGIPVLDPFTDDLSLLLETDSGPVVLLGCAHAGIVEILDDLSRESGHTTFHAVIGGTHLGSAPGEYINRAAASLDKYDVRIIGASHCTGFAAASYLASRFNERFRSASVGNFFEF